MISPALWEQARESNERNFLWHFLDYLRAMASKASSLYASLTRLRQPPLELLYNVVIFGAVSHHRGGEPIDSKKSLLF